ncbi:(2Fe-2S)-binding protein [Pollutimonas bauzanensis]|uniref:Carbon-monoxide dehydrogenase small subunit n=1 Tax=Pollutimonas bauzanensis TaxID=658167 RepID=A0A1M5QHT6_9BURK|nr:(2Fe-2S)-binding protein [Pollutimonas bauzanensis]SHH13687.1 carbon-monoxide dehydrogenase small subunit [Pollutimonas bauzanensis]
MKISFKVNGKAYTEEARPDMTLVMFLRDVLGLTGTKHGCDGGECGACTVLLDGVPMNGCLVLAPAIRGREITTIEGLAQDGELDPLQQAFIDHSALQCGYCGSGMLLAAKAFLEETPNPTREQVKKALSGNLCRCTGYLGIIDAVMTAAKRIQGEVR